MDHSFLLYILMAAAPSLQKPSATVPELRAIIAPFLSCAKQFDPDRIEVEYRLQEAYDLVNQGGEQRLNFNWEPNRRARELDDRRYQIHTKIDEVCRRDDAEKRLHAELVRLGPTSVRQPTYALARQFFATFLQLDRDLAALKAGKVFWESAPSAPPPGKPQQ